MRSPSLKQLGRQPVVYVLGTSSTREPVKIGYTMNGWGVHDRLAKLQTGNPRELHIHQRMDGSTTDERFLHYVFRHCRLVGEWFDPMKNPRLLDFVEGRLELDDLDHLELV